MGEQHQAGAAGTGTASASGEGNKDRDGREHGQDTVSIKVNDKPVEIHRGRQAVSEIKRLGGVPSADELAEVIAGQPLKPLADNGSVVIKGGEEFVSYPKDSSSSFAGPLG